MKKKLVIICLCLPLLFAGIFGFLSGSSYIGAQKVFNDGGYVLTVSDDSDALNKSYYFDEGTKYSISYDDTVNFKDINNEKVKIDTKSFIHYDNESLAGLDDSVLMDTDNINENQLSYYSISNNSVLTKAGSAYKTSNAGSIIEFSNFIWKISGERYMIVSDEITLCVSETSQQTFKNYIELEYVDAGVAHLVNQEGTYSTISSDAYLLLSNGIRIYIGSKNVSTDEGIIMNMSQMVVNSDDNIEIIPDDEYTVEVDKSPRVIINASDGADGETGDAGEAGEAGKAGEKGNQGTAGQSGTEGDPGEDGTNAKNSGIAYIEQVVPFFALQDEEITSYGISGNIVFSKSYSYTDENGRTQTGDIVMDVGSESVIYMIIDNLNSSVVWRRAVNPNDLSISIPTMNPLSLHEITTLKPGTEYTLAISASYIPVTRDDTGSNNTFVRQQLYTQTFTTKDYGFTLTLDHTTSDAIYANLEISREAAKLINSMDVGLYYDYGTGNGKEELQCGRNYDAFIVSNNIELFRDDDSRDTPSEKIPFSALKEMAELDTFDFPVTVQIKYTGHDSETLNRNDVYYLRINDVSLTNASLSAYPNNAFVFVEARTAKQTPELGVPSLYLSGDARSVNVAPGFVNDVDGGIISYRYEFYLVDDDTGDILLKDSNNQTINQPIYKYETTNTRNFSVPIFTGEPEEQGNSTNILPNKSYKVREIALFNNNQYVQEIASELSSAIFTDTSSWPSIEMHYQKYQGGSNAGKSAPSIVDGSITITDPSHTISERSKIIVKITPNDGSNEYYVPSGVNAQTIYDKEAEDRTRTLSIQDVTDTTYENGTFTIPFVFDGLKQDSIYNVSVTATDFKKTDGSYSEMLIFSQSLQTGKYVPIYVSGVDVNSAGVISDLAFSMKIYFSLDQAGYKDEVDNMITFSDFAQAYLGIENTLELSIKSLTYFKIGVYKFSLTDPTKPDTLPILDTAYAPLYAEEPYVDPGYSYEPNYYYNYSDNNRFYTGAYLTSFMNFYSNSTTPVSTVGDLLKFFDGNNKYYYYYQDYLLDILRTDPYTLNFLNTNFGGAFSAANIKSLIEDATKIISPTQTYGEYVLALYHTRYNSDNSLITYTNSKLVGAPEDYTIVLNINENIFEDSSALSTEIEQYRMDYPTTAKLYLKIEEAYDYTYGRGGTSQTLKKPNKIQIGNTSDYTGTIYDQFIECEVAKTLPTWKDNQASFYEQNVNIKKGVLLDTLKAVEARRPYELLNKNGDNKMYSNLYTPCETDEEYYTGACKIVGLKKDTVDDVYESWQIGVATDTNVGYAVQVNSAWLSGYAKAVRYSVYDSITGDLITRSYNDFDSTYNEVSDSYDYQANYLIKTCDDDGCSITGKTSESYGKNGWIPKEVKDSTPKWVFYYDQMNYVYDKVNDTFVETRAVARGESIRIETEVLLLDIQEEYTDGDGTKLYDYVYPSEEYKYQGKVISKIITSVKQTPEFYAIQYDGSSDEDTVDTYYTIIKDTDNAFAYTVDNTDPANPIKKIVLQDVDLSTGNTTPVEATIEKVDASEFFVYEKNELNMLRADEEYKSDNLPFLYKLTIDSDYQRIIVPYTGTSEPSYYTFATDSNVSKGSEVIFADCYQRDDYEGNTRPKDSKLNYEIYSTGILVEPDTKRLIDLSKSTGYDAEPFVLADFVPSYVLTDTYKTCMNWIIAKDTLANGGEDSILEADIDYGSLIVLPKDDSYFQIYAIVNPTNVESIRNIRINFENINPEEGLEDTTMSFDYQLSTSSSDKGFRYAKITDSDSSIIVLGHSEIGSGYTSSSISYTDISEICNPSTFTDFEITMDIYYETSNYGIRYASTTLGQDASGNPIDGFNANVHKFRYEEQIITNYDNGGIKEHYDFATRYGSDANKKMNDITEVKFVRDSYVTAGESWYDDQYQIWITTKASGVEDRFDLGSNGLKMVPKEVKVAQTAINKATCPVRVSYVKPTVKTLKKTTDPGMYLAKFSVELATRGSLIPETYNGSYQNGVIAVLTQLDENNVPVEDTSLPAFTYYDEKTGTTISTQYVQTKQQLLIASGELSWDIQYDGLLPDTNYRVDVYGAIEIGGSNVFIKLNSSTQNVIVKTLRELNVSIAKSDTYTKLTYEDVANTSIRRDSKYIEFSILFRNLYLSDLYKGDATKGIKNAHIEVYTTDQATLNDKTGLMYTDPESYYEDLLDATYLENNDIVHIGDTEQMTDVQIYNMFEDYYKSKLAKGTSYTSGQNDYISTNYVYSDKIKWEPGANHELGTNTKYIAVFVVNYATEDKTSVGIFEINSSRIVESISFRPSSSTGIEYITKIVAGEPEEVPNYFIKFNITGIDARRVMTGKTLVSQYIADPSQINDVTYLIELHEIIDDGDTVQDNIIDFDIKEENSYRVVYSGTTPADYESHVLKYVDVGAYTSSNSKMNLGTYLQNYEFTMNNLKKNTEYYFKIYSTMDLYNKDTKGIVIDSDNSKCNLITATGELTGEKDKNNKDCQYYKLKAFESSDIKNATRTAAFQYANQYYYVYVSNRVKTMSGDAVSVSNINLVPEIGRAYITGNNLGRVTQIIYQLSVAGVNAGIPFDTNYSDVILNTDDDSLKTSWKDSGTGQGTKCLIIPNMSNPEYNYYIVVQMYTTEKDEFDHPQYVWAVSPEGSYTYTSGGGS